MENPPNLVPTKGWADTGGIFGVDSTYPNLLVPLDGDERRTTEEVEGHHDRPVLNLPDLNQEPEPLGMAGVAKRGHHVVADGHGGSGGPVEGGEAGGGDQGAAAGLLHAPADAVAHAADLAEGAAGRLAQHAARRPARAALAAVGGEDGLGDLRGGRGAVRVVKSFGGAKNAARNGVVPC